MSLLLLVLSLMLCAVFRPSLSSEWSYHDVDSWPLGFPECGGQSQSPIDFTAVETFTTEPFTFINYGIIRTSLQNNGHSLKVLLPDLSLEKRPRVSGGGLGATYVLDSFHFHWGSTSHQGSEHLLHGCAFDGEMHLVHVKEGYGSVSEALEHKDGLAVLGVWLTEDQGHHGPPHHHRPPHHRTDEEDADMELEDHTMKNYEEHRRTSSPNWWLAALTPTSPTIQAAHTTANLRHLLPEDVHTFYRYNGSLTTPPCTENVLWTVMATPVKAPRRFLRGLRAMVNPHTTSGHGDHNNHLEVSGAPLISDNFRPTQPIESRKVFFSGDLEERPTTCSSQNRQERRECLVFSPVVVVGAEHGERENKTVTDETARMQNPHEPGLYTSLFGDKLMTTDQVETMPNQTVEEDDLREFDSEEDETFVEESQMLNNDEAASDQYQTMNEEDSIRMKRDVTMIENANVVNEEETIAEGEYSIEKGVSEEEYYCHLESPLNLHLRDTEVVSAPHLAWRRVGDCNTVSVANDGRVLKARFSTDAPIWELVGGNLNNDRYYLAEMVLRWSSEHHLAGFSFPLEVQLVHYNTRYTSLREALYKPDGVVVVARLFQEPVGVWGRLDWLHEVGGGHNNPLHTIISPIQHHKVKEAGSEAIMDSPDIPLLMGYMSSYYEYRGALPHAPPCSTPATWIVLRKVGEVSRQQVSALRTLLDNTNTSITANPRPVFYSPGRKVTLRVNSPHLAQEFQSILSLAKRDIGTEPSGAKNAPEPPKQAPEPPKQATESPKQAPEPPKQAPEPPKNVPVVKEGGPTKVDDDGNGGFCTTPAHSMVLLMMLLISLLY